MHISLDSALGRQKRLNSVGESVLQIAPDAAAAYSLRSLTGGDPDVVRVRRESDNTEKDFSGSQIESGEMARWVNEQPTLPLDLRELDTNTGERDGALIEAAAAYSLRKLKEDFTGDVVEVRRNVDGETEGFTADEVTDGTLENFVSTGEVVYSSDFSVDANNVIHNVGATKLSVTGNNDGISDGSVTKDNVLKVENIGDVPAAPQLRINTDEYGDSTKGSVTFTYYVPTGHPIVGNYWHIGASLAVDGTETSYSPTGVQIVGGAWTTATVAYENKPSTKRFLTIIDEEVADGTAPAFIPKGNVGDFYYISEIKVYRNEELGLPLDQATGAAAAYSLRNLKASGTDVTTSGDTAGDTTGKYVVQVRRSSDDAVKSFTAAEVADGTLESWVNTEYLYPARGISQTSQTHFNITKTDDRNFRIVSDLANDGLTDTKFITILRPEDGLVLGKQRVTFDVDVNSGDISNLMLRLSYRDAQTNLQPVAGSNSFEMVITDDGASPDPSIYFAIHGDSSFDVSISNFQVHKIENDGHVKTWYDQSGSDNHAVQTDTAKQPKIVEGGTYLGEIDFDGTQYFTAISSGILTDIQDTFSAFVGTRRNNSGGYVAQASSAGGTSPRLYLRFISATIGAEPVSVQLNGISDQEALFTLEGSSGVYNGYKNGANTAGPVTTATTGANAFTLGASSSGNSPLDGKLKEFIIYDSDQSDKRRAIEENIANHYDISLAAFSRDGTVKTWYDQTESRTDDPQNITGFLVERSNDIMNGEWDKVADVNGKVAFTHADDVNRTLNWNGTRWEFKDSSTVYYYSTVDTTYPFDVSNEWVAVEGSGTPDFESFDGGWYDPLGRGGMLTMHADVFQPTIVRNGTYLGEIDFDESNDKLNAHFELDIDPADSGFASIVVARVDSTDTTSKQTLLQNSPSGSRHLIQWQANGRYQFYAKDAEGDTKTFITNDSFGNDEYKVFTTTIDSNSLCRANVNGVGEVNNLMNESVDFGSVDSTVNSDEVISPSGNPFMGAVKEMIFYLSDQSDNRTAIEANIGETYGITDIPAANDTVNGFVQTWYDQSGNVPANDAEQSAASSQPKIVDGGSLVTGGGLLFDGADDYLFVGSMGTTSDFPLSTFAVFDRSSNAESVARTIVSDNNRGAFGNVAPNFTWHTSYYSNSTLTPSDGFAVGDKIVATGLGSDLTDSNLSQGIYIGRDKPAYSYLTGTLDEIIIYNTDQSANRPAIEANIANQYGITLS